MNNTKEKTTLLVAPSNAGLGIPKFCTVNDINYEGEVMHGEFDGTYYVLEDGDCYKPEYLSQFSGAVFLDHDPRVPNVKVRGLVAPLERRVRPPLGEMKPFEWMQWEALDFGAIKLAEACEFLRSAYNHGADNQIWQASRRMEVEAECERLRRYLTTIRDTGMTAEDAAQHAADALRSNV